MKLHLHDITSEGLPAAGTFEKDIFELDPADSIQPNGRVSYDIQIDVDDGTLIFAGSLRAPMTLKCVKCLEDFSFTLEIPDYLSNFDIAEDLDAAASVELAQLLREDLLLALPTYPHCDEGDDPDRVCPQEGPLNFESAPSVDTGEEEEPPSQWGALDKLSDSDDSSR